MPIAVKTLRESGGPFGYESVTISSTVTGLTASAYTPAEGFLCGALVTVEGAQVRFRVDGGNPSTTEGHLLNVGDTLTLVNAMEVKNFKAIRAGASDATLRITYYRR